MNRRRAFTIIEVLVVAGIIAILAGLISGVGRWARINAKRKMALNDITAFYVAFESYKLKYGVYPGYEQTANAAGLLLFSYDQAYYFYGGKINQTLVKGLINEKMLALEYKSALKFDKKCWSDSFDQEYWVFIDLRPQAAFNGNPNDAFPAGSDSFKWQPSGLYIYSTGGDDAKRLVNTSDKPQSINDHYIYVRADETAK